MANLQSISKELDILPSVIKFLTWSERDIFTTTKYAKFESRIESIPGIMMRGLKSIDPAKLFNITRDINLKMEPQIQPAQGLRPEHDIFRQLIRLQEYRGI